MKIYLSGGITGLSKEEYTNWRYKFINAVRFNYDCKTPTFFDPSTHYLPDDHYYKSEREVMEFELSVLRKSDLVVVNFNAPQSIGTAMEIAIARERHIPIVGLCKDVETLHPWLIESCTRICSDMRELVEHVVQYYISNL